MNKLLATILAFIVISIAGFYLLVTQVSEGQIGIKLVQGKAVEALSPGMYFVNPVTVNIKTLDTYERTAVFQEMKAASSEQLPISLSIIVNYRIHRDQYLDLYRNFKDVDTIQNKVLDPRIIQAVKSTTGLYSTPDILKKRTEISEQILKVLIADMENYPIDILKVSIENVGLSQKYLDSVNAKSQAREAVEKARYELQKQEQDSLRDVQTAQAKATAVKLAAEAEAEKILLQAQAEAQKIALIGKAEADRVQLLSDALKDNPDLVRLEIAKQYAGAWKSGGSVPSTIVTVPDNILNALK